MVRKKSRQRVFLSWLLLTFFAAGQVIIYSHQHHCIVAPSAKTAHQSSRQTVSDTCPLCDAMHFNYMALTAQVYAQAAPLSYDLFTARCYAFVSVSLILSGGRAPPISHFSA